MCSLNYELNSKKYPIWTSAHDDRHDEEWERPIISDFEGTQEIIENPLIMPVITIKVEGTGHCGTAWYSHRDGEIFAISIWDSGKWKMLSDVKNLAAPLVLVAVPRILHEDNIRFLCADLRAEKAVKIM